MKNFLFILAKEIRAYFNSPVAFVVATIFAVLTGYQFYVIFSKFSQLSFEAQTNPNLASQYGALNVTEMVIRPFFNIVSVVMLIMLPMLTMRAFAEEWKAGTMELLLTFPVRDEEAILGKFAGCMGIFAMMLFLSFPSVVLVGWLGDPEWEVIVTGYLGLFLMGGAFIAMGLFMSSLTENQVIAAALSFAALLILHMVGYTSGLVGEALGQILEYLSIMFHFQKFAKGVIDTSDIIYYLIFTALFLFLSMRSVESRRWRG
jgi:ABC-2 type transport system permease protein